MIKRAEKEKGGNEKGKEKVDVVIVGNRQGPHPTHPPRSFGSSRGNRFAPESALHLLTGVCFRR